MSAHARSTAHFLEPLLSESSTPFLVRNCRSDRVLAARIERAFDSASRRRGLLGRNRLEPGCGIVLAPCESVHTLFMRFPIDVVFARRDGQVVKVCRALRPWRAALAVGAFAAIEVASGASDHSDTRCGDRLRVEAASGLGQTAV